MRSDNPRISKGQSTCDFRFSTILSTVSIQAAFVDMYRTLMKKVVSMIVQIMRLVVIWMRTGTKGLHSHRSSGPLLMKKTKGAISMQTTMLVKKDKSKTFHAMNTTTLEPSELRLPLIFISHHLTPPVMSLMQQRELWMMLTSSCRLAVMMNVSLRLYCEFGASITCGESITFPRACQRALSAWPTSKGLQRGCPGGNKHGEHVLPPPNLHFGCIPC